jgi:hypothetical protein
MAWYKIRIVYGPGHQGTHIEYLWCAGKVTKEDKSEWCREIASREYMDWPIGRVRKVPKLPSEVRAEKVKYEQDRITSAQRMLKVLGA